MDSSLASAWQDHYHDYLAATPTLLQFAIHSQLSLN
jgi:hypothetical protein